MRQSPTTTRLEYVGLALVLLLAAALRLGWLGLAEFKLDEAHLLANARAIAAGESLPTRGTQSSVGVYLPPIGDYLYALPMLVSPTAMAAIVFTALLGVGGVALCWWTARRAWGAGVALAAGLLFATSPWAVVYARKIWQPDLVPPVAMAWFATGVLGFREGRGWAQAAHLALLVLLAQLHFAAAALAPVTLVFALAYRRRLRWRALPAGAALGAATAIPFGLYLWRERAAIAQTLAALPDAGRGVDAQALGWWRDFATGRGIHALTGAAASAPGLESPLLGIVQGAFLVLTLGGLGIWLYRALRRAPGWGVSLGAALWLIAPLVAFTAHSSPVHLHYLAAILPVAPLAAGQTLALGLGAARRGWRYAAGGVLALLVVAQVATVGTLYAVLATRSTAGGFGMPIERQLAAVEAARARGERVVVLSPGDNATSDEWAAVLSAHLHRTPHTLVDGRHAALLSAEGAAILATGGVERALETYALLGALEDVAAIATREGEAPFTVARLRPADEVLGALAPAHAPRLLANGVEVLGYHVAGRAAPGGTLTWRVAWRVAAPLFDPTASYQVFNHLETADGRRLAQADSATVPAHQWRVGDVVVQAFDLTIPPDAPAGPYHVRVGMYTLPEMAGQYVLDVAGNPTAEAVILGPFGAP